jgi:hypothetical protein
MISPSPAEVAPTVGRLHSGSEQSHPERFVLSVNSSLFLFLAIGAGCSELPPRRAADGDGSTSAHRVEQQWAWPISGAFRLASNVHYA